MLGLAGYDGPRFATCSYCWGSREQDREDYSVHNEWLGYAYPGDPVGAADLHNGCTEHGIDHPHLHCRESQR